ncbi:MAG: helicase-related protein, partial [Nitriliruptoraceae bacterium]
LLDLVLEHRSTLIFVNARRLAERLAAKLNELHARREEEARLYARDLDEAELARALQALAEHGPGAGDALADGLDPGAAADAVREQLPELVKAHHGSLSRERRLQIEDELKSGRLRALVATSSLELGIDMGAVDQVVQVASPGAVSRGLQRIGRAGHQVDQPSRGVLLPKYRGDLVETAVVVRRMRDGDIESTRYPRNPLDVLAQHIVAMVAVDDWDLDELAMVIRRAAPFQELSDEVLHAVLDLLAGRYPSEEFGELRPRIVWDRLAGTIRARAGAQRLAVTNPGTIPDRGLFGVFLADGTRVGELDEEMVHESRAGETFVLGASTWRIEEITHDRVVVTPAPGEPGKLPFWHGDGPGRPYELGRALGVFQREVLERADEDRSAELTRLQAEHDLDAWAADNLVAYLEQQRETTGAVPDDRTMVVERFRDELGDWRICLLSPFGAQLHAPWAMAIERRLGAQGLDPEVMWTDDGIVLRLADTTEEPLGADASSVREAVMIDPEEIEGLVVDQLAGTALFTTLFREAAGRALLLPKRMPGKRTALWQQRQRAADLLQVASRHPRFPLLLEATREALQDVFDLPRLRELLGELRARTVRVVEVETASASPFAQSLLFGWVGQYMYEYDAPLAERRAAALALDRDLLRELLGGDELRELLDAEVLARLERELQRLAPPGEEQGDEEPAPDAPPVSDRRARDADELHDVLRELGPLSRAELAARSRHDPTDWIEQLLAARRAIAVRVAGEERLAVVEDAARLRDALGVALPPGLPQAHTEPVDEPLTDLVARYARTHGPFHPESCAQRLGVPVARVVTSLGQLEADDRVVEGGFRPDGSGREWIDVQVLRRLKRRSLAALRQEVEPVEAAVLGRFLPAWQQVAAATGVGARRGPDALVETVTQLQGAPIPASVLEADVLPARVADYRPSDLDELVVAGEVVWLGVEPLGAADGRVVLCLRDQVERIAPASVGEPPDDEPHTAIRDHLDARGASFWPELFQAVGISDQDRVLAALWDLVWAGEVTNDTLAPLRALVRGGGTSARGSGRRRRGRPGQLARLGPPAAQGRWSLTRDLAAGSPPEPTARATAIAEQLLERHGVLTRGSLRAESVPGGFATVYPVLRAAEEAGRVRRGYVVADLGAAQFAAPGAIDRLRACASLATATTRRWSRSRPRTRPSPTAPHCHGRRAPEVARVARRVRSSCWSTASRQRTWGGADAA